MLRVDGVLQALQFAFQSAQLGVVTLKQTWLKPPVEILDTAVALRATGRDQEWFDPEAQTHAQHPGEIAGRHAPTNDFAGIVELDLSR